MKAPKAPGVGAIATIAPGLIVAGLVLMIWGGLYPAGLVFAGVAAYVANAVASGVRSLLLFGIGAIAVHSLLVPLAVGVPSANLSGLGDINVSLPEVSIGGTETTTPTTATTAPTTAVASPPEEPATETPGEGQ